MTTFSASFLSDPGSAPAGNKLPRNSEGLKATDYGVIAVAAMLLNLYVILNPGFFGADEWQLHEFIARHGLVEFIRLFGRIYAGSEFGTPVRPIGFIQEGLTSYWMGDYPFIPHGFSVFLQAATALAFARLLSLMGFSRLQCCIAAILFATSPLSAFATGWTAACFDQWYCLFSICVAISIVLISDRGFTGGRVAGLLASSAAAILSKETAIVLPIAALVVAAASDLLRTGSVRWRRVVFVACLVGVPIAIYLMIRMPALIATIHQPKGPYTPGITFLPWNVLAYFSYPFSIWVGEASGLTVVAKWKLVSAIAVHILVIAALIRSYTWRAAAWYLVGYFLFLLPVMTLPSLGAHYLYASAFSLAFALSALIVGFNTSLLGKGISLFALVCVGLLSLHTFNIQMNFLADGVCQNNFLGSVEKTLAAGPAPGGISVYALPGARIWAAERAVFDRPAFATVHFVASPGLTSPSFGLEPSCRIVAKH